jgi:hypothetical protein
MKRINGRTAESPPLVSVDSMRENASIGREQRASGAILTHGAKILQVPSARATVDASDARRQG